MVRFVRLVVEFPSCSCVARCGHDRSLSRRPCAPCAWPAAVVLVTACVTGVAARALLCGVAWSLWSLCVCGAMAGLSKTLFFAAPVIDPSGFGGDMEMGPELRRVDEGAVRRLHALAVEHEQRRLADQFANRCVAFVALLVALQQEVSTFVGVEPTDGRGKAVAVVGIVLCAFAVFVWIAHRLHVWVWKWRTRQLQQ